MGTPESMRKHLTLVKTNHRNSLSLEQALILTFANILPRTEMLACQKQAQSSCGGGIPTINIRCRWYALLLTRSVNTQLALCGAWSGAPWCYWSVVDCDDRATCSWSRLTALLVGRLLGVLLFTGASSMGRAVEWSPIKPEGWSGWFTLKSSPTCHCRWLHCDLQNVPREHTNCTAGTVRANRSEASWQLTELNWTELSRLLNYPEADPSVNTARNNTWIVAIVGYHRKLVYRAVAWIPICLSITWSPVFPTCGRFPWEAPTISLTGQNHIHN
jgi:hypothetical protein